MHSGALTLVVVETKMQGVKDKNLQNLAIKLYFVLVFVLVLVY